jgi:hypothetical protein
MLMDVIEFIENPQGTYSVISFVVGLQELDLRNHGLGKPREARTDRVFENVLLVADGEHVFVRRTILRGEHQFPYQIVEGGSEIAETVSENQSQLRGELGIHYDVEICGRIALYDQLSAWP